MADEFKMMECLSDILKEQNRHVEALVLGTNDPIKDLHEKVSGIYRLFDAIVNDDNLDARYEKVRKHIDAQIYGADVENASPWGESELPPNAPHVDSDRVKKREAEEAEHEEEED